ncbi:hypothetical protein VP01_1761g4 [Puccinia sorghi]|uniref:Uncharacterized protein n=1 Tax=Puccinia sorghi TaxID=27349 RepID=A0A0L6VEY3_9BASI|nr:hypothetical protein VP01_1761g4 [Puccinia sorghi]
MDEINPTILKTTIEAIPILTEENFSSWRTQISALFKLGGVKDQVLNGKPALEESDNTILVYNKFSNISFDISNIEKFVTELRASLVQMQDVGICMDNEIVTYDLLRRLPASLDNINQAITHSKNGEDIKPQTLLNHLKIHLNELKVSAISNKSEVTTMFTEKNKKCSPGKHNPLADHPAEQCWFDANKANAPWVKKQESTVCSLSTFSSISPSSFILDSGLTAHMISD